MDTDLQFTDPIARELGELIAERRNDRGWKQEQLAGGLGVTQGTVSRWESGERYPSIEMLKKLARVLDFSDDELLRFVLREGAA